MIVASTDPDRRSSGNGCPPTSTPQQIRQQGRKAQEYGENATPEGDLGAGRQSIEEMHGRRRKAVVS
jgi:hypothetical protein